MRSIRVENVRRPKGKAIVMLGREDDVFCAGLAEQLCPVDRVPFLDALVEARYEGVNVAQLAKMLPMKIIRR